MVAPKFRLPGVTVAPTIVPVPERATVCELLVALSLKTRMAVRVPVAVGWNAMLAVQLDEAPSSATQLLVTMAKSAASGPNILTLVIGIATGLPLFKLAVWIGLDVPTSNVPKVRLAGATVALPISLVPDNTTVCGLFEAVSVKDSVAVNVPVAGGVKVIETLQAAESARLAPQLFAEIAKFAVLAPDMVMLFTLMGSDGPFVSVTVNGALVVLGAVGGNVRVEGETLALTTAPVPESATISGDPAESVIVSVAVRGPVAVGSKLIAMVQLAETARLTPQVLPATAKSPAFGPEMTILLTLSAAVPPFVNATVCAELLVPITSTAKLRLPGFTVALSIAPNPESVTVCGLLLAPSMKTKLAVRALSADGVNVIPTVQVAAGARAEPHVLVEIAKSKALAPVTETLLIGIAEAPLFCSVAVCTPLTAPRYYWPSGNSIRSLPAGGPMIRHAFL